MSDPISENLSEINTRIDAARNKAGRSHPPQLIAVSKRQPDHRIQSALDLGLRVFGENRVQEAEAHWAHRKAAYPDLELRLIGPLQTNKAEHAVALFHAIDVLDRPKLARKIAEAIQNLGKAPEILVQINTGEEPQKGGVLPQDLDDFILKTCPEFELKPVGLMCIPPANMPAGPHFGLLQKLAKRYELPKLSMGMSSDYESAIRFGATHIRIGSSLFGARD